MASASRQKANQNIQVYVRCRPINDRERLIRSHEVVEVVSPRELVVKSAQGKKFTFDRSFGPSSQQNEVYRAVVEPLIEEVLSGYSCTVFAYGQTGTGKTHTMVGDATPQSSSAWDDKSEIGIIPRALSHLFEELRLAEVEFSMRASYLELYNEEPIDLLASGDMNTQNQIRIFDEPNKKGSIIVQGLEEIPVHSTADVYKLLAKGQERRKMAPTLMNAQSSRSHTIFSILVHIKENTIEGEDLIKTGKLNLVDLAGSENISKAGNEKGIRARESVNINQSLLTLGRVITALVERTPHVPYRESKLTRLLQESLGGRTKTSIIATISPGHKDMEETINTLEYAHRAKNIQNKPELNQKIGTKKVLKEYTEEIDKLKRDLEAARERNGVYLANETYAEMQYKIETNNREISEKTALVRALKDDMEKKENLFTEVSLSLTQRTMELKSVEGALDQTKKVLDNTQRRYQEKKQLLNSHKRTEEMLTGQAMELMNVARDASNETHSLHATIERRKQTDAHIKESTNQFSASMNGNFDSMADTLKKFTEHFHQQASGILKQYKRNTGESTTACGGAISNVKSVMECQQGIKRDIDSSLSTHKTELSNIDQKHNEAKKVRLTSTEQMRTEAINATQTQQDGIMTNLESQSEFYTKVEQMFTVQSTFLTEFSANLDVALKQNAQVIEKLKLSQKVINEKTTEGETLARGLLSIVQSLRGTLPDLNTAETMVNKCEADIKTAASTLNTGIIERQVIMAVDMQTAVSTHTTIKSQATNIIKSRLTDVQKFADQMINTETEYDRQTNEYSDQVSSMIDDIDHVNEAGEINIIAGMQGIVDDMECEQKRIAHAQNEMEEMHTNMNETQANGVRALDERIAAGRHRLTAFQTDELRVYTPTGQTPNKRDYNYPRTLVATSPASNIVRRFWNEHDGSPLDCSMTICEEGDASPSENAIGDNSPLAQVPMPFGVSIANRLSQSAAEKVSNSLRFGRATHTPDVNKENTI